jgi:outer membrane protein OmpA-like peptidoglycan-associated protein
MASNKSEKIAINQEGYYYSCGTCGENYLMIPYLNGEQYQTDTVELHEETCQGKRNPLLELNIVPKEVVAPVVEVVEVPEKKYTKGDSMILENLVFKGKSQETDDLGNKELDLLSQDLLENPDLILELRIHTDAKKSERYNWLLSKKRGIYIGGYLDDKGVNPVQYTISAIGEAETLNNCGNGKPCSKEEHAANNRVELRVLEEDKTLKD